MMWENNKSELDSKLENDLAAIRIKEPDWSFASSRILVDEESEDNWKILERVIKVNAMQNCFDGKLSLNEWRCESIEDVVEYGP